MSEKPRKEPIFDDCISAQQVPDEFEEFLKKSKSILLRNF
jgi:hypothetical protein